MEIEISTVQLVGLGLSGLIALLMPFVFWFVWRKKAHASWIPLIIGVIGYLFIGTIRGIARAMFLSGMQDTPWTYYILQAVFAGVFEEGGRYLIFRHAIPHRDLYRDAVSYGIGHGGLESVIVDNGSLLLFYAYIAFLYRTQGMDSLIAAGLSEEESFAILQQAADSGLFSSLLIVIYDIDSLLLHISLSVLVLTAVHYDNSRKWFWAAIGLHTFADIIPAFNFTGHTSRIETDILILLFDLGVFYLTYRVWEHYHNLSWSDLASTQSDAD